MCFSQDVENVKVLETSATERAWDGPAVRKHPRLNKRRRHAEKSQHLAFELVLGTRLFWRRDEARAMETHERPGEVLATAL